MMYQNNNLPGLGFFIQRICITLTQNKIMQ